MALVEKKAGYRHGGRQARIPNRRRVSLFISDDDNTLLEQEARRMGLTKSDLMRFLIKNFREAVEGGEKLNISF